MKFSRNRLCANLFINIERQQRTIGDGLHAAGREIGCRRKDVFAAIDYCWIFYYLSHPAHSPRLTGTADAASFFTHPFHKNLLVHRNILEHPLNRQFCVKVEFENSLP